MASTNPSDLLDWLHRILPTSVPSSLELDTQSIAVLEKIRQVYEDHVDNFIDDEAREQLVEANKRCQSVLRHSVDDTLLAELRDQCGDLVSIGLKLGVDQLNCRALVAGMCEKLINLQKSEMQHNQVCIDIKLMEYKTNEVKHFLEKYTHHLELAKSCAEDRKASTARMEEVEKDIGEEMKAVEGKIQECKQKLQQAGLQESFTYPAIVKQQEAIEGKRSKLVEMQKKLLVFGNLPPDIHLAQLEVNRKEAEASKLESALQGEVEKSAF